MGLSLAVQSSFSADWEKSVEGKPSRSSGLPFTPQSQEWLEAREGTQCPEPQVQEPWHPSWEASALALPAVRHPHLYLWVPG